MSAVSYVFPPPEIRVLFLIDFWVLKNPVPGGKLKMADGGLQVMIFMARSGLTSMVSSGSPKRW